MTTRYSTSLEKPAAKLSEFKFFLQRIIEAVISDNSYKPANCDKIKITGKIFFIPSKDDSKDRRQTKPQEFEYSSDSDVLVKSAIESQVHSILHEKIPENYDRLKIKFIVYFYTNTKEV